MKKQKRVCFVIIMTLLTIMLIKIPITVQAGTEVKFKKYYKNVLIPKYGSFPKKQNGIMHSWEDEWMKVKGIMNARVMDFDLDGKKEMLVIRTKAIKNTLSSADASKLILQMYEIKKGKVTLVSQMAFSEYHPQNAYDIWLSSNMGSEAGFILSSVKKEDGLYLVCEKYNQSSVFADGLELGLWLLQYKNDKFRYISSFTQTGGGSSDFEYTVYSFKNGKIDKQELYYCETPEFASQKARYEGYGKLSEALTSYFAKYAIKIKTIKAPYEWKGNTILTSSNNPKKIFHFRNKCVFRDYITSTYKFKAVMLTKNKF